jgi:hypothetical protein
VLNIAGAPVFVKRIPLTDLERHPHNVMSTANVFGLPTFCHYGVTANGSPGFGAWRELAANAMTTNWVIAKQTEAFHTTPTSVLTPLRHPTTGLVLGSPATAAVNKTDRNLEIAR